MKVTIINDYRKFTKGTEYNIDFPQGSIVYFVGSNGCGKSSLLRGFRSMADSLKEVNKKKHDGITSSQLDRDAADFTANVEVEDFPYTNVYSLDAIIDDPLSLDNCASAVSMIEAGGLKVGRISKGEKAVFMFVTFIKEMTDHLMHNVNKDFRGLIILDEVDEGFDLRTQMNFNTMLNAQFPKYLFDVFVVSHNTICMLSESVDNRDILVFDVEQNKITSVDQYVFDLTGKHIVIQ